MNNRANMQDQHHNFKGLARVFLGGGGERGDGGIIDRIL